MAWVVPACVVFSAPASAAFVTVEFDRPIYGDLKADQVTITYPMLNPGKRERFETVVTDVTRFSAETQSYSGLNVYDFIDSSNDLYAYCYDIYEPVGSGQVVTYDVDFAGAETRTLEFLGAVNYVMNGYTNEWSNPFAWVNAVSSSIGAAIQLGIWESRYDTGWSITDGSFKAKDLNRDTSRFLDSVFAVMDQANALDQRLTMVFKNAGAQDLLVGRGEQPPVEVSEPAGLALLGLGLLGFMSWRGRRHLMARTQA